MKDACRVLWYATETVTLVPAPSVSKVANRPVQSRIMVPEAPREVFIPTRRSWLYSLSWDNDAWQDHLQPLLCGLEKGER